MQAIALDKIHDLLKEIKDPEIPVLSIIDLGIVRDVRITDDKTEIDITPTYSGCPAMKVIEYEIIATLKQNGIENVKLKTVYSPAWTTDWINEEAKERLRQYGIAPPEKTSLDKNSLSPHPKKILCPRCGSAHTEMISQLVQRLARRFTVAWIAKSRSIILNVIEMDLVIYKVEGTVAKIILNRPDKFNSFNRPMALQMQDALDAAASDKNIRAIYITGEGKAFCAGQDLAEAIDPNGPGIRRIVDKHYNPIIRKIRSVEKPVVCGVNGVAAGAGANIVIACDVVIAAASATFIQAFSKIGLVPDSGGTFILPRLIGWQRASALMMLGDKVTASEALQMGMVYKVVENEKLQEEAMAIATTLSQMPTKGIGLTKRLLNESFFNSLEKQLELERDLQEEATKSYDYNEGVKAFLEKRKPVFKGE